MRRDYHKWFSPSLGRDMEMLVFSPDGGHNALPAVVFPTSCGRYFEFEDRGMVGAIAHKIDAGQLQLFCVDSVDSESWYNQNVGPRWRIARHMQYEDYVMQEVLPYLRQINHNPLLIAAGCSFGGYHAANISFRHPDIFTGFLSMGGAFNPANFLGGYHDRDVYFNIPTQYLPNISDAWYLDRYRRNTYVLATGEHDMCWDANEELAGIMRAKGIPVRLDVWGNNTAHDWPWWHQMIREYL
jgi:esterase/lipase superfamily enzyme